MRKAILQDFADHILNWSCCNARCTAEIEEERLRVARLVCKIAAKYNPRFDKAKFMSACNLDNQEESAK